MKSFVVFVLGVAVGVGLLFGFEHFHVDQLFHSKTQAMAEAVSGNWQGSVSVNGYDADLALTVKDDGKALTGVVSSSRVGSIPCDSLQVDPAGKVTFSAQQDGHRALFNGTLAPDMRTMTGSMSGDVPSGEWKLTKRG